MSPALARPRSPTFVKDGDGRWFKSQNLTETEGEWHCYVQNRCMIQVQANSQEEGQFIVAEIHGAQRPFTAISLYRHHSDTDMTGLFQICHVFEQDYKEWICASCQSTTGSWARYFDQGSGQPTGRCSTSKKFLSYRCNLEHPRIASSPNYILHARTW